MLTASKHTHTRTHACVHIQLYIDMYLCEPDRCWVAMVNGGWSFGFRLGWWCPWWWWLPIRHIALSVVRVDELLGGLSRFYYYFNSYNENKVIFWHFFFFGCSCKRHTHAHTYTLAQSFINVSIYVGMYACTCRRSNVVHSEACLKSTWSTRLRRRWMGWQPLRAFDGHTCLPILISICAGRTYLRIHLPTQAYEYVRPTMHVSSWQFAFVRVDWGCCMGCHGYFDLLGGCICFGKL